MKEGIILMSDTKDLVDEHLLLREMFELGLETYHIRKPKYSTQQLREYIERIDKKYRNRVVIHHHHELCVPLKLKGIHMTERHRKKKYFKSWIMLQWIKFRRPEVSISASYHSPNSLLKGNPGYTYVFLSPIFDSISKIGYKNTFSDFTLREALQKTSMNVFALGGVEYDKLDAVKNYGFKGCALVGSVWTHKEPVEEFKRVMAKWKELQNSVSVSPV